MRPFKINQKGYIQYVFNPSNNTIVEGFYYADDAKGRIQELIEESAGELKNKLKSYTKKYLVSKGINPDDNSNWKDVTY